MKSEVNYKKIKRNFLKDDMGLDNRFTTKVQTIKPKKKIKHKNSFYDDFEE